MSLIENEIEKLLETNPAEWLAYKMILPNIPETGGEAMDIVKKYTGMAIESATKQLQAENKHLREALEVLVATLKIGSLYPLLNLDEKQRIRIAEQALKGGDAK